MTNETILKKILKEIYLQKYPIDKNSEDLDLLSGKSGICLFINNYEIYFNIPIEDSKLPEFVNSIFKSLERIPINGSLMYGLSGFLYGLENSEIIENRLPTEYLLKCNQKLITIINNKLDINDYDFFTGYLGIAHYIFQSRFVNETQKNEILRLIIQQLNKAKFESELGIFWINGQIGSKISNNNDMPIVNMGIAHGQLSIIRFLLSVSNRISGDELFFNLLNDSWRFILNSKDKNNRSGLNFPSHQFDLTHKYTFFQPGWCYGDLTLAILLYKSSVLLRNINYMENAFSISKNVYQRIVEIYQFENDLSLCHGLPAFINLSKSWYNLSRQLEYEQIINKLYKNLVNKIYVDYDKNFNITGLMYGTAGIGLTLLDEFDNQSHNLIENLLI